MKTNESVRIESSGFARNCSFCIRLGALLQVKLDWSSRSLGLCLSLPVSSVTAHFMACLS
jgi:hypothetical protein